jgi:O-acetylserine/cysteine efflux transporter
VTHQRLATRDVVLLVSLAIIWGFNFVPIRWALDVVPPFALAAIRFFFAAIPMVFFVPRPKIPTRWIVLYGLLIGVGQFGLLFLAIQIGLQAGLASLLAQLQVFLTIALAALVFRDRATTAQLVGAVVAAMGIVLLVVDKLSGGATGSLLALILIVVSAGLWAVANNVAKHIGRAYEPGGFSLVVWSSLASPLPLAAISLATENGTAGLASVLTAGPLVWASIAFIVIASTLFGFAIWNRMLQRYTAAAVTPFALIVPVAGLASAFVLLGETLSALELGGAIMILLGLSVAVVRPAVWVARLRPSRSGV